MKIGDWWPTQSPTLAQALMFVRLLDPHADEVEATTRGQALLAKRQEQFQAMTAAMTVPASLTRLP